MQYIMGSLELAQLMARAVRIWRRRKRPRTTRRQRS